MNKELVLDINKETNRNENFRTVVWTGQFQLTFQSLLPGEAIGLETHPNTDQFIRVESGRGKAIIDGKTYELHDDIAVIIPAGSSHNIVNDTTDTVLKVYSIYSNPQHHPMKIEREAQ